MKTNCNTSNLTSFTIWRESKRDVVFSFLRLAIALIFVTSGMLKGVNLVGFSYNVSTFLGLFGVKSKYAFEIGVLLSFGEIVLGFIALNRELFIRCHWICSMIMTLFTYVTYVNFNDIYGGIESCGCFGEFIHLDPSQSFYKNVILLLVCVILSIHASFKSSKQGPFFIVLMQKLPKIMIASLLPIVFSIVFIYVFDYSVYLLTYIVICIISLATVVPKYKFCSKRFSTPILFLVLSSIFYSCTDELENALAFAGENRVEMEKVLEHFRKDPDPLKYEAAQFLISNMQYHYSYSGDAVERYNSAYMTMAQYPVQKRDSVFASLVENLDLKLSKSIADIRLINSQFLIKAIDDAFEVWNNSEWHTKYDKSLFFDYVLPYRLTNEQPSDWRAEIAANFPYLVSDYVISRRGVFHEAEDAVLFGCSSKDFEIASQGKIVDLDGTEAEVSFNLSTPLGASKLVWLRYASTSSNPEIRVTLDGRHLRDCRLTPTISTQELRDSRFGIPVELPAGESTLTIKCKSGRILLDRITLSAVELAESDKSEDFTSSLYSIKNVATGNFVAFDTLRQSLLHLVKLVPLEDRTDSCTMLRFDYKGEQCWSVSSFHKDTTDLCLEARYCSTDIGDPMSQYHYQGGFHQRWIFIPCGKNSYKIMGKDSGLFLESYTNEDGEEILIQMPYAEKENQKWQIERCGINSIPNPRYTFGSATATAMKVLDRTGQFEWMSFKGSIPPKTSSLIKAKTGDCRCEASFTVSLCRYLGIPAAIDFTPNYGNRSQGHSWSVLINPDGTSTLFHTGFAPDDSVYFVRDYIRPKIYRHRFQINKEIVEDLKDERDVPNLFRNADFIDVTAEYGPVSDVKRPVPYGINSNVAYICVFDNKDWVPVYYGKIKDGNVTFNAIGRNIIYIAATYTDGMIVPFGNPFLVDGDGNIREVKVDEKQTESMKLSRKYPFMSYKEEFNKRLDGGEFQASDNINFTNTVLLHTHKGLTDGNWYDIPLQNPSKFRYVRYIGPSGSYCNINEIEFISPEGKKLDGEIIGTDGFLGKEKEKVFDGDILSGFEGIKPNDNWIGMKFNKPVEIGSIRYIPRTDGNCIEIGDEYELFYWAENRWKSAGKKKGETNQLCYEKIPIGGLYLLRDLTKGKEERIFTYEDGKQVWW